MKYALLFLSLPSMLSAHPIDDAIVKRNMQAEPFIKKLSPEKKEEYRVYAHQLNVILWDKIKRLAINPKSDSYSLEYVQMQTNNLAKIITLLHRN